MGKAKRAHPDEHDVGRWARCALPTLRHRARDKPLIHNILPQTHCETDRGATEPLLILLRRFATESAREEARLFCDEIAAAEDDAFVDDMLAA